MERGENRPHVKEAALDAELPQTGNEQTGSVPSPFDAFVDSLASIGEQRQGEEKSVQLIHPATPFFLMDEFNFHYEYRHWNDIGFQPTEEQNQFVEHVKLAYGIIAHPFSETQSSGGKPSHVYQKEIEHRIAIERVYDGRNRVVLTDAEREILVKIAQAAGIPCNSDRSEYFFDEIPRMTFEEEGFIQPTVVDADQ